MRSEGSRQQHQAARVFISYARADGERFAKHLCERLERLEPEITVWQDRARLKGGIGWWSQIAEALEVVQFLVIVMTPAAVRSENTRKEWRHARRQGVCVYPVKGTLDAELDYDALPRWMRKTHFYDLEREWDTFVQHLKGPCLAERVPFMAPDLPTALVERSAEYEQILHQLLDDGRENPVTGTIALRGAGGFGKTTLAAAICHDDDAITAFHDGILWVTLGEKPDLQAALTKLFVALTGERLGFVDVEDLTFHLGEKLADKTCLIVIDDVWEWAHLQPFLRGGEECARLITTRQLEIAAETRWIPVDEMTSPQAVELITAELSAPPDDLGPFRELVERLGRWPLMIELAGATLKQRIVRGDTLEGALDYLNRALDRRGVVAFDHRDALSRSRSVAKTIEVSLELLAAEERERYANLAIFPAGSDVPLTTVGAIWGLDDFETEELVQRLDDYSLVKLDLRVPSIWLHDVMRAYLADQQADSATLHAQLVDGWGDPHKLPDEYAWRSIASHLVGAARSQVLRDLLLDYHWLQAALDATDVAVLIANYDFIPDDTELCLVQGAIRLAAHALAHDKMHLAGQLLGRLQSTESKAIHSLLGQATRWQGTNWLRPLTSSLTPPEAGLVRTLTGHEERVSAVAITPSGQRVVSGSWDTTLRVWDLESGTELRKLEGHEKVVSAVVVTPDGRSAISGSGDGTLKLWDLDTGEEVRTFNVNAGVDAVAVTPDGRRVVSASKNEVKVWDLASGREDRALVGHKPEECVFAVAVTPDGRQVVTSATPAPLYYLRGLREQTPTLRVWDLETGRQQSVADAPHEPSDGPMYAHLPPSRTAVGEVFLVPGYGQALGITTDGKRAIWIVKFLFHSVVKVWDLHSGRETAAFDRMEQIEKMVVMPDGEWLLLGLNNGILKLWNPVSGEELLLEGPRAESQALAVTPDGKRAISGLEDGTLRIWNLERGVTRLRRGGHADQVQAVAVTPDGQRAISAGFRRLKVWRLETGLEEHTLVVGGPRRLIRSMAVVPPGRRVITVDWDTGKVWDLRRGVEVQNLEVPKNERLSDPLIVTPDGRQAICTLLSPDGEARTTLGVWDLGTGALVHTLVVDPEQWGSSVVVAMPDGQRAISGEFGVVKVWNLVHGLEVASFTIDDEGYGPKALAVTPDGRQVIVALSHGDISVWDLESLRLQYTLEGHSTGASTLAVRSDGRRLISASLLDEKIIKVWDLRRGREERTLEGHSRAISDLAVTRDGGKLTSVSIDGDLKVWDLETGGILASFFCDSELRACDISPDGQTIVAGDESGQVHLLRLEEVARSSIWS